MKPRIILFAFFLIVLFSLFTFVNVPAQAPPGGEVSYPSLPGAGPPPTGPQTPLARYLNYLYRALFILSGIVILGVFIWGGVLILTSAGNPQQAGEGTSWLRRGAVAAVLLFSLYFIIMAINPEFIQTPVSPPPNTMGVSVCDDGNCGGSGGTCIDLAISTPDFVESHLASRGLSDFTVNSVQFGTGSCGNLDIAIYQQPNYEPPDDYKLVRSVKDGCRQSQNYCFPGGGVSAKSIKFFWTAPGVYLGYQKGTDQIETYVKGSISFLENFHDKATYIKIKPSETTSPLKYIAVLHEDEGYGGTCKIFAEEGSLKFSLKTNIGEETKIIDANPAAFPRVFQVISSNAETLIDEPLSGETSSVTVFNPLLLNDADASILPGGVTFYIDEEFAGEYKGPFKYYFAPDVYLGGGGWIGPGMNNDKITSIQIEGNYIVILFENNFWDTKGVGKCQILFKSDPSLRDDPMGRCGGWCSVFTGDCYDCLSAFIVLPVIGR